MYSSTSTITLECNQDYFHDYYYEYPNPVSTVKVTFLESKGVLLFLSLCHYLVFYLITATKILLLIIRRLSQVLNES